MRRPSAVPLMFGREPPMMTRAPLRLSRRRHERHADKTPEGAPEPTASTATAGDPRCPLTKSTLEYDAARQELISRSASGVSDSRRHPDHAAEEARQIGNARWRSFVPLERLLALLDLEPLAKMRFAATAATPDECVWRQAIAQALVAAQRTSGHRRRIRCMAISCSLAIRKRRSIIRSSAFATARASRPGAAPQTASVRSLAGGVVPDCRAGFEHSFEAASSGPKPWRRPAPLRALKSSARGRGAHGADSR